ncbi:MAG TPA: hypothetical protein PK472_09070 [Pseudomonadota bacterium]|nr:hypothetical protein [Pseudomonadota bacterium]
MKNVYLVVEGVHDAAFIGRLLTKHAKLAQIKEQTKLPPGWQTFVDNFKWPTRNRQGVLDISRLAVPAPLFFGHPQHDLMVAVSNAEGIANLAARLESDLEQILLGKLVLDGVGVVLDSDEEDAQARLSKLLAELRARDVQIPIPDKPELGVVKHGKPRFGVFAMPSPTRKGTLEDLLLDCAQAVYPKLLTQAQGLVDRRSEFLQELEADETKLLENKPAGRKKATVGVMGAFLKPGKAIQNSIHDHRWVSKETLSLPQLAPLVTFLDALLDAAQGRRAV